MPIQKKTTPISLISSFLVVASLLGGAIAFNDRYITRAEAADAVSEVLQRQQYDKVETELSVVNLEISYLEDKISSLKQRLVVSQNQQLPSRSSAPPAPAPPPPPLDENKNEAEKRLNYLKERRTILERYQLELKTAK